MVRKSAKATPTAQNTSPRPSVGPLYLVGMGLCDEGDLPARSLEALASSQEVFAESYTNLLREGTLERLEKILGRPIVRLPREEVEGEKRLLSACQSGPVALLVPGDPMTATTHESLRQSARSLGIEVRILHASSIFTAAAGAAGLHIYKFGKTATIPYWRPNFEPTSFVDLLAENSSRGAHTLCLLDIDPKLGPMKPSVAIGLLQKAQERKLAEKSLPAPVLRPDSPLVVLWHVGWPDQHIWAGPLKEWPYGSADSSGASPEPPGPAVLIWPGKMHFSEEDSLKQASQLTK